MAATKTQEQRKKDFINKLNNLYPDYKLISDYINNGTKVTLKHRDGYLWNIEPRMLDGKRQCKEVALKLKKENNISTKKVTKEEFEKRFFEKHSRDEYEIRSEFTRMEDEMIFYHKTCGREYKMLAKNAVTNKSKCNKCYHKTANTVEGYNEKFQNSNSDLVEYTVNSITSKDGHIYGNITHNCKLCNNNTFDIRISDMTSKHAQRCPLCKLLNNESKACIEITKFLEDNNISFIKEKTFDTCIYKSKLRFDFYIENTKILIEYDGIQHFKSNGTWFTNESVELTQKRDEIKNQWCKNNGYTLIRISYKENHLKKLEKELKKLHIL